MLATHGFNNIITCICNTWNNTKTFNKTNNKNSATASAKYKVKQYNVHTI